MAQRHFPALLALLVLLAASSRTAAAEDAAVQPSHAPPRHHHHHHHHQHPWGFLDGAIVNGSLRFDVIPAYNAFDPASWSTIVGAGVPGTCNLLTNSSSVAIEPRAVEFGVAQATGPNVATVDISTSGTITLRHTLASRFLAQTITLASSAFVGCTLLTGQSDHPVAISSTYNSAAGTVTLSTPAITATQLVTYTAAWRLDCPVCANADGTLKRDGTVCRPKLHPCDDNTCTGTSPYCPPEGSRDAPDGTPCGWFSPESNPWLAAEAMADTSGLQRSAVSEATASKLLQGMMPNDDASTAGRGGRGGGSRGCVGTCEAGRCTISHHHERSCCHSHWADSAEGYAEQQQQQGDEPGSMAEAAGGWQCWQ